MRVCDICKCNRLESDYIEICFKVFEKEYPKDHELIKLASKKEICIDCFKKLIKLFRKGGEKE